MKRSPVDVSPKSGTHESHRLGAHLALVAALAVAACGPATTASVAEDAVVRLAQGDESALASFASDYVDHQAGTSGAAALRDQVRATRAAHPKASAKVYRVMSEGDQVFVHSQLTLDEGTRGFAAADIFRFEKGRIVEHWGNRQEVPATTASGNDMFSTLSSPSRLDPDPTADVEVTRATMMKLATALAVDKDLGAWDRYTQAPYFQHSTNTPNGIEAVKQIWGPVVSDPTVVVMPVTSVAEGDLFVTMNLIDSPILHITTVDLSRVRDGLIVEHWDVVEFRQ